MTDAVAVAERRALAARDRLSATLASAQERLAPRVIARDAMDGLAEGGFRASLLAAKSAKRHPLALFGTLGVLTLFLTRRPLVRALRHSARQPVRDPSVRHTEAMPVAAQGIMP